MNLNFKTKPTEYVHLRGIKCGCEGCREPAFAQFFICSLDSWMAVCKEHDLEINLSVLRVVMSKEKADLCLKAYVRNTNSPKPTSTAPANNAKLRDDASVEQPRLICI